MKKNNTKKNSGNALLKEKEEINKEETKVLNKISFLKEKVDKGKIRIAKNWKEQDKLLARLDEIIEKRKKVEEMAVDIPQEKPENKKALKFWSKAKAEKILAKIEELLPILLKTGFKGQKQAYDKGREILKKFFLSHRLNTNFKHIKICFFREF
jgi:hypothetical protein